MPRIEDSDSDEEMSDAPQAVEQATPPPIPDKSFTSKADLMSGLLDDDIPDYDFDEDSDDSDLEIYGKIKSLPPPIRSAFVADSNDEGSITEARYGQDLGSPFKVQESDGLDQSYGDSESELMNESSEIQQPGEEDGEEPFASEAEDEVERPEHIESEAIEEQAKNGNEEDIKREDDVSIKSEDDTESIHYADGDDEGSTINVQPSSEATPSTSMPASAGLASHGVSHEALTWITEAPTEVQNVLNSWFGVHGRKPPPCATWPSPQYLRTSTSGKEAIWLHSSGERLIPSMFHIGDLIEKQSAPTRRILVVQGPTKGPYIVSSAGAGRWDALPDGVHGGTRYRIWLGRDCAAADGFERGKASIWKGFAHNFVGRKKVHSKKTVANNIKKPIPQPSLPKGEVVALADSLPEELRTKLEAWMSRHGRSYPPCISSFANHLLFQSSSGTKATWWHESGEQLEPRAYIIDSGAPPVAPITQKRVLVVQGPTKGPFIVRYHTAFNNSEAIGYRIWEGIKSGDARGFERGISVVKVFGNIQPTCQTFERWRTGFKANGKKMVKPKKRDESGNLRPRGSITAPSKYVPSRVAETKRANFAHWQTGKRKRFEDDEEDGESLLNRFISPATEKTPQPFKASSRELVEHIHNNVVLLFFPSSGGAPRVRLLGTCDNVQKLFAQALAGDVFADKGGSGTKVLALTFGGGQNKSRSLVEDDDQDFEDLVSALKVLDCWLLEDGALQGSLTVEVRAK